MCQSEHSDFALNTSRITITEKQQNMNRQQLVEQIFSKRSFLCVGLDTDIQKIPEFLQTEADGVFTFNKRIIDATAPYCIAYKPNLAFYESLGAKGTGGRR